MPGLKPREIVALQGHMTAVSAWRTGMGLAAAVCLVLLVRGGVTAFAGGLVLVWLISLARPQPSADLDRITGRTPPE